MSDLDQTVTYTIVFNKQTGDIVSATSDVEALQAQVAKVADVAASMAVAGQAAGDETAAAAETATEAVEEEAQAFQQLQAAQEGSTEATNDFGNQGADVFDRIGSRLTRIGLNLILMQAALQGVMAVIKDNEGFQQLQASFEAAAASILDSLAPALTEVTRGLSGLVTWVGAAVAAISPLVILINDTLNAAFTVLTRQLITVADIANGDFRAAFQNVKDEIREVGSSFNGLGDQTTAAMKKAGDGFQAGLDQMSGAQAAFTKQHADVLDQQLQDEIKHNDAMLKEISASFDTQKSLAATSYAQKLEIVQAEAGAESATISNNLALQEQILKNKLEARQITQEQYDQQLLALQTAANDAQAQSATKAADETLKIKQEQLKAQTDLENAALADQEKHNTDALKAAEDYYAKDLNGTKGSLAEKLELIKGETAAEINVIQQNAVLEEQIVRNKAAGNEITAEQAGQQLAAIEQQTQDKITAAMNKGAAAREKVTETEKQNLTQQFEAIEKSFVSAVDAQIKAGKGLNDALAAGAGAVIESVSNQAAGLIEAYGASSAAAAFNSAIIATPGPLGFAAGVAAAGATLAFYSGLAAIVGGAGAALGSAATGGGDTSSSSSSSGSSSSDIGANGLKSTTPTTTTTDSQTQVTNSDGSVTTTDVKTTKTDNGDGTTTTDTVTTKTTTMNGVVTNVTTTDSGAQTQVAATSSGLVASTPALPATTVGSVGVVTPAGSAAAATPASGSGTYLAPGQPMSIQVTLNLNGQALLQFLTQESFAGNLVISGGSIAAGTLPSS